KIEQRDEGQLAVVEVLLDVRAGGEGGEEMVDGQKGPQLQLDVAAESAADLQQVSVELLEVLLEAAEQRAQALGIGDELLPGELLRLAVFGPPHGQHLLDAALGAGARGLAVLLHQRGD